MTMMTNSLDTVLITGANRGIGLEFVAQYLADGWRVIACCRDLQQADELNDFKSANLHVYALDVSNVAEIHALAEQLQDTPIDLLINNAGVYPETSHGKQDWEIAFRVNTMAPYYMALAFTPHLRRGKLKKLVTLSSKMGSIDDNTSGGSYMYRSSKCAANMVMKSLSIDLAPDGIAVLTLHPGWVKTDMGGPHALIDAKTSVSGMRRVIGRLNPENTGKFIAYDGQEIAW